MRYYPINLDLRNRRCLVVGGGSVGTRKVTTLIACGAAVTVVSPQITPELRLLADNKTIVLKQRHYQTSDMSGMFLVIGATDNKELNWRIYSDAERIGKLCNIADRPEACNFILPSVVNRGDLIIAVSTSGKSPAFAKKLRKDLENQFGEEYADFLQIMGEIRRKLLMKKHAPEEHKPVFEKLIKKGMLEMIREKKKDEINRLLSDVLGKGYDFDSLIKKEDQLP
jgi:precorrin-2 dehydrogenase / sirohydrochlorin ferrochelatase